MRVCNGVFDGNGAGLGQPGGPGTTVVGPRTGGSPWQVSVPGSEVRGLGRAHSTGSSPSAAASARRCAIFELGRRRTPTRPGSSAVGASLVGSGRRSCGRTSTSPRAPTACSRRCSTTTPSRGVAGDRPAAPRPHRARRRRWTGPTSRWPARPSDDDHLRELTASVARWSASTAAEGATAPLRRLQRRRLRRRLTSAVARPRSPRTRVAASRQTGRGAGLPVLRVRRHVRLHPHERHPRRRGGASRCSPSSARSSASSRPTTGSGWGSGAATAPCSCRTETAADRGRHARPGRAARERRHRAAAAHRDRVGRRDPVRGRRLHRHGDQPRVAPVRRRRARRDPRHRRGGRARWATTSRRCRSARARSRGSSRRSTLWRIALPEREDELPLSFVE